MRIAYFLLVLIFIAPRGMAQNLPELGDVSQVTLSALEERRIGEMIMRDIRVHEPTYYDDPELTDYINNLGYRLAAAIPEARQDFEFFLVRDPTINAFAMPGGYIGVHTGLILTTQSESELAGVLSHEMGHVTQHHIARQLSKQSGLTALGLAGLAVAILAARSSGDVAQAALMTSQAGVVQAQLNYSRDFEREADRVGFQTMQQAGFNVQAMATFFERLQKSTRLIENNAPAYLRTHPLTAERIADMQNRAQNQPYRQVADSFEFQLVRAKLRAAQGTPRDATEFFEEALKEKRYASEFATHYGYAVALARARDFARAESELTVLRRYDKPHPMVESLAAQIKQGEGDINGARELLRAALIRYPDSRPLNYAYLEVLQASGRHQDTVAALADRMKLYPHDARLYALLAKSYAALGKRLLQHQAQAELYYLQGSLPAAIEQLQMAQKSGDGDFYQMSGVDARLRELRRQQQEEAKKK